jgi:hypothetical protein
MRVLGCSDSTSRWLVRIIIHQHHIHIHIHVWSCCHYSHPLDHLHLGLALESNPSRNRLRPIPQSTLEWRFDRRPYQQPGDNTILLY